MVGALLQGFIAAALIEEPVFRGFLIGYLRELGLNDGWSVLVQAVLFASGHLRYVGSGRQGLLMMVFVWALIWGWQRIRHGTIVGTILNHALVNATVFLFIGGAVTSL
ncbi:CPBP family intramembrane glutamic endopeptidase [Thermoflexus sp.]|uniref:CPBP family intramembrane glutamic endopeptidase n=1 Tax=Thermoflexus sp. TaxID=1969742 RepID=UPI002ADE7F08|nr:CPBP family intramembrane glutamic endopeptidase [Thermoflexus sp.]